MFGSNSLTTSIGVFTINLPRIRYLSSTESEFKARLWRMACVGKTSLEIKRKILEQQSEAGLYPFSTYFLRDVKQRTGQYWFNHFSTIGIIGMNEVLLNFIGKEITTDGMRGKSLQSGWRNILGIYLWSFRKKLDMFTIWKLLLPKLRHTDLHWLTSPGILIL